MTKTITIKTCYIWIPVYIIMTIGVGYLIIEHYQAGKIMEQTPELFCNDLKQPYKNYCLKNVPEDREEAIKSYWSGEVFLIIIYIFFQSISVFLINDSLKLVELKFTSCWSKK